MKVILLFIKGFSKNGTAKIDIRKRHVIYDENIKMMNDINIFVDNMEEFKIELDEEFVSYFGNKKHNVTRFLHKIFKICKDFIIQKTDKIENISGNVLCVKKHDGGQNKIIYLMTEKELLKNSYNLKNRYITAINNTEIKCIVMTIENSTIGFICNSLKSLPIQLLRQYKIDRYKVDLFIPELLLVIECDEFGHEQYNIDNELKRSECIKGYNYTILRFNPNEEKFDLSNIISNIIKIYLQKIENIKLINNIKNNIIDNMEEQEYDVINYNGKTLDIMKENNKTLELQLKLKELELNEKEIEFNTKLYENPQFFDKLNEFYKLKQNIEDNSIRTHTDPIDTIAQVVPVNPIIEAHVPNNIVKRREIRDCGHLVQVYNGNDTKELLYVYNGITDATRNMEGTSFTSIKNACKKKEIYKGYRWHFVNRNDPNPNEVKDIGDSIVPRYKSEGFVAMLNNDMTEVEKVFTKQKDAAEFIDQAVSAMSRAINFKTILSDKYFISWDMVDVDIQNKYLENNELPCYRLY